jgi:magnesium-transporting ATPase (P-type)
MAAGLFALSSFVITYSMTGSIEFARSFTFIVLGLDTLIYVFSVRTLMVPFWKSDFFENKWLIVAVVAGLCTQMFPFLTPTLRKFFGLTYLPLSYWGIAFGLSFVMFFMIELFKFSYWKRK